MTRMKLLALALWIPLFFLSCTNEEKSRKVLRMNGFYDIQITGYNPMKCSDQDLTSTGFRAKRGEGQVVSGTVCCGALKGCTIRY